MAPVEVGAVRTREDLARFIQDLADDLRQNPGAWENRDLGSFLEALSAWVADMDGYHRNQGEPVPAIPEWRTIAAMLAAARVYE